MNTDVEYYSLIGIGSLIIGCELAVLFYLLLNIYNTNINEDKKNKITDGISFKK